MNENDLSEGPHRKNNNNVEPVKNWPLTRALTGKPEDQHLRGTNLGGQLDQKRIVLSIKQKLSIYGMTVLF